MSIPLSPQGRISITIGKVAVGHQPHKAQLCHQNGTEVILGNGNSRKPDSYQSTASEVAEKLDLDVDFRRRGGSPPR
jgi:hypothetical protein